MSKKQKWKECWKVIKGWLKHWLDIQITFFAIAFGFCITYGIAILIWPTIEPKYPELERTNFVTFMLGGFLLIFQIMISARRATAAENTAKAMQETVQLTETGNIAERFKNAIEHLGHESVSVRLGGIYALHHIAQEVEEYRDRVFEILCAHIRETTTHETYEPRKIESEQEKSTIEIQSILNLLLMRTPGCEIYKGLKTNLENVNLAGYRLIKANLQIADLQEADLQGADLKEADLKELIYDGLIYKGLI